MNVSQNQNFDVIIIGGGVIGLSIARELCNGGVKNIAIIEKNADCGAEASSAAAGMLAPQVESDKADDFLRLCQMSRDLYPSFAADIFEETAEEIELDRTGTLYLAVHEWDLKTLEERFAWQRAARLPVEKLTAEEVLKLEPNISPGVLGALHFPLDWQVENRRLVEALCRAAAQREVQIVRDEIKQLIFRGAKIVGAASQERRFYASVVVVAAGAWASLINLPSEFKIKIEIVPVLGQMMRFCHPEPLLRHVIHTARGYLVPRRNRQILLGATVENRGFRKYNSSAGLNSLLEAADEISPAFGQAKLQDCWSGLRPKSPDGLPLLGEFPTGSGLYFATGHYRNGILLAPITAKLIAERIANAVDSPYLQIFNPARFQNSNH